MIALWVMIIQAMLLLACCWLPSNVLAFTGVHQRRISPSTININLRHNIIQSRSISHYRIASLGAANDDSEENQEDEDIDPLMNDQREGMADAVSVVIYPTPLQLVFVVSYISLSLVCWIRFFNCR